MAGLPISVIDDDESTRIALAGLLRLLGFEARTYESAEEFLTIGSLHPCCCIISDVHMSGLSGHRSQAAIGREWPIYPHDPHNRSKRTTPAR